VFNLDHFKLFCNESNFKLNFQKCRFICSKGLIYEKIDVLKCYLRIQNKITLIGNQLLIKRVTK